MALKRNRPHMPGYGIRKSKSGLLAWTFISEHMESAHNYWMVSVSPQGRPHTAPVWGLWHEDIFFFSSGKESRKARNWNLNPSATVHLESGDQVVILEGDIEVVDEVKEKKLLVQLDKLYQKKYDVPFLGLGNIYRLKLRHALAWREKDFPTSATGWTVE